MKDLFTGSLGRLNNHGGSPMFTTPNTVYVPPEYEVETDVPSVAEFVTCSLDGRLWVWKRSRRYYVSAFRWNAETERLEFVSTTIMSNIEVIGRGIDWILTKDKVIQASDNEPYIFMADLFKGNDDTFLYSPLRSKSLPSGIDPITDTAWGKSNNNGNSEGYGYFNRSAFFKSIDKQYALLPSVGDWNITQNFLVKRPEKSLTNSHNSMLNIRPLIPLEINETNPPYGCGFENDIGLTCYDDELWARGFYYIGKAYILPAIFAQNGTVQEFYLYISPDYKISPYKNSSSTVTISDWLDLSILHTDKNLYGFLTAQISSLDDGLCYSSDELKLFTPSLNEWQELSEEGNMYIDTLNNSCLVLNDNKVIFVDGLSYTCNKIQQWLAPSNNISAIISQSIFSHYDSNTLITYTKQSFRRDLISKELTSFPLKKFLVYENSNSAIKALSVYTVRQKNKDIKIEWNDIFRNYISIKFVRRYQMSESDLNKTWTSAVEVSRTEHYSELDDHTLTVEADPSTYVYWYYYDPDGTLDVASKKMPTLTTSGYSLSWDYYVRIGQEIVEYLDFDPSSGNFKSFTVTLAIYQYIKKESYTAYAQWLAENDEDYNENYYPLAYATYEWGTVWSRASGTKIFKRDNCNSISQRRISINRLNTSNGSYNQETIYLNQHNDYLTESDDNNLFCESIVIESGVIFFEIPLLNIKIGIEADGEPSDGTYSGKYLWNFAKKSPVLKLENNKNLYLNSIHYIYYDGCFHIYELNISPNIQHLYSDLERSKLS